MASDFQCSHTHKRVTATRTQGLGFLKRSLYCLSSLPISKKPKAVHPCTRNQGTGTSSAEGRAAAAATRTQMQTWASFRLEICKKSCCRTFPKKRVGRNHIATTAATQICPKSSKGCMLPYKKASTLVDIS